MRYRSKHRPAARVAIDILLAEAEQLGLRGRAILRHVYRGYPWGERRGHKYRIWLHEVELCVRGVDLPFTSLARRKHRARKPSGQLVLFDRSA